jgi:peptidoglycan-associated lipoprotein
MRALAVLAMIPLLVACASGKPTGLMVGGLPADNDISGHWSGSWVGAGLFQAMRQETLTLDMTQRGNAGYGKLVIDGAAAAESVPWEVRQQGLGGIRVFATVSGSKVKLIHEADDRIFTADMTVAGDQMIGQMKGRSVRLVLGRQTPAPPSPQQSAKAAPLQMPAQVPVTAEPVPAQPEQGVATVAVAPPQEESTDKPQAEDPAQAQRPRAEDYVAVPELKPVYFDFDKAALRPDAVDALTNNTTWLKANADALVLIEGNCDERGTAEYNLALGDRRAKSAMEYLEANGIPKERLSTISYGKERPVCTQDTEECKNQNRRADFRIKSR